MKPGRGALAILALFLASSGALRLGEGVGQALANAPEQSAGAGDTAELCPAPPAALARALGDREARAAAHEAAIDDRMAALSLAEAALSKRLAEVEAAEVELKRVLALADGAAEQDLTRLTAVYEAMKPADAAKLFQTMAPDFAAGFLGRMQPQSAAAILSGMPPDAAYSISVLIAGRNALVPRN